MEIERRLGEETVSLDKLAFSLLQTLNASVAFGRRAKQISVYLVFVHLVIIIS